MESLLSGLNQMGKQDNQRDGEPQIQQLTEDILVALGCQATA